MPDVKRLQIMIDEDLDAGLEEMARAEGTSKAALIRRFVRSGLKPGRVLPPLEEDPIWRMVGAVTDVEPEDIDTVVYGLDRDP